MGEGARGEDRQVGRGKREEEDAGDPSTATSCTSTNPDHQARGEHQGEREPEEEGEATDSRRGRQLHLLAERL